MMFALSRLGRILATAVAVLVAAFVVWRLWNYYMLEPWTRDGKVRADIVGVTPDVSGLLAEVLVQDNQAVRTGDVLFRIDRARFDLAVRQAEAVVASRLAALQEASRENERYQSLSNIAVSQEKQQQTGATLQQAAAMYQQAQADLGVARLNLSAPTSKPPSTASSPTSTSGPATTSPPAAPSPPWSIPTHCASTAISRRPSSAPSGPAMPPPSSSSAANRSSTAMSKASPAASPTANAPTAQTCSPT